MGNPNRECGHRLIVECYGGGVRYHCPKCDVEDRYASWTNGAPPRDRICRKEIPMSKWNHAICGECWFLNDWTHWMQAPPIRLKEAPTEICCFCGKETKAGIYVRRSPEDCPCGGEHA